MATASGIVAVAEGEASAAKSIPRFGIFEASFTASGKYANPYTDGAATATLTPPNGKTPRTLPLFWDGGNTWKLRFAPDVVGQWSYGVQSSDARLNGKQGVFSCVLSENRGSVEPMAEYGHHFQYQDGTPLWWMGETGWALMTDSKEEKHTRDTIFPYLDKRAAQNFNVVHSMIISESDWGNSGGLPFGSLPNETLNPKYFAEVDVRVRYAAQKGLVVGLVLAWTDKGASKQSWQKFRDDAARLRYARYVVARFSAFPVYFIVAGEWDSVRNKDAEARVLYNAIGARIKADDAHGRMVGIHPNAQNLHKLRPFASSAWNDFGDYQQNYGNLHACVVSARNGNKPVVNSEYAYYRRVSAKDGLCNKANSENVDITRGATWDIVMGGGYFVAGFGSTYFGGNRMPGTFDVNAPQNADWERDVQHIRTFWTAQKWWLFEPKDEILTAPFARGEDEGVAGDHAGRPPRTAYWAMATAGDLDTPEYVAYLRGCSGPCTLAVKPGTSYRVRRFDPRTGEYADLPVHDGKGSLTLTPPDGQDWVFEVRGA